ncbi:MAG: carboxypeptidase-like regulatory domain-containing protein [Vicinamibacterales bacterium]
MRRLLAIAAVVACVLAERARADACICFRETCGSVVEVGHLFVATVSSIEPGDARGFVVVRLTDAVSIRGGEPPSVLMGGGGTSCSYQFRVGERYLVDAREVVPGRFDASNCGHTKPLAAARGLIDFATDPGPAGRPRIFGRIARGLAQDPFASDTGGSPVSGVRVTIRGPVRATQLTNAAGEFRFVDLPDGAYTVTADVSLAGFPEPPAPPAVTLADSAACADVDFLARSTAKVTGLVVDSSGAPAPGHRVEIFPSPYDQWAGGLTLAAISGPDGRYTIDAVSPGRYVGGLHVPFPTGTNPAIPVRARAAGGDEELVVPPDATVEVAALVAIPAPAFVVDGRVVGAPGAPLGGLELVLFALDGLPAARTRGATTRPDGAFTMRLHRGVRYRAVVQRGFTVLGRVEFVAGDGPLEIRLDVQ